MATYLDRIVAEHRAEAAADTRDLDQLRELALAQPEARGFRDALAAPGLAKSKRRLAFAPRCAQFVLKSARFLIGMGFRMLP